MIVMVEDGRLGNQLFQYLALASLRRPGERIVLFGFQEMKHTFVGVDATTIRIAGTPLVHLRSMNYERIPRWLKSCVGFVGEDADGQPKRHSSGKLSVVEPSWFQRGELAATPAFQALRIRSAYVDEAQHLLRVHGLRNGEVAFVHVRGGDYRQWPSPQAPAVLDSTWYAKAVSIVRRAQGDIPLILLGDDLELMLEVRDTVGDGVVLQAREAVSLALMAACPSGVVSASSFAFWGAALARRDYPDGLFIAPEFWVGHRTLSWFPRKLGGGILQYMRADGSLL